MEPGCILPYDKIDELKQKEFILSSLAFFCKTTEKGLLKILQLRNDVSIVKNKSPGTAFTNYGYTSYTKTKGKKSRTISVPVPYLKSIQKTIKERLNYIPISLHATAGRLGDRPINHVKIHKDNPYLLTLDIKDAYPSIDTHRVYKNLQGALNKPMGIWFPYIENKEDKDLFIRALTHLCVYENHLPQGAPTSTQIQNIVMTSFDKKILSLLPNLIGPQFKYSRYADDIAISFPFYTTLVVLKEQLHELRTIIEQEINDNGEKLLENVKNYFNTRTFNISDKSEQKYLSDGIDMDKMIIMGREIKQDISYKIIGTLNSYKQNIRKTGFQIINIKNAIYKILSEEGFTANILKTKTRTPQSNNPREITGLSIDNNNIIGVSKKKKSTYIRLFDDLINLSVEELKKNKYYHKTFFVDDKLSLSKIHYVIDGIYKGYLGHIYGLDVKIPKEIRSLYQKVKEKYSTYTKNTKDNQKSTQENGINIDKPGGMIDENPDQDFPF